MITIVGVGSQYIHQNLGVWCLAAGLRQYQTNSPFQVLEINVNQPLDESIYKIYQTKPQILGFSCYIWNVETVLKLIAPIKRLLPGCKIICGGPEVSFRAENFLRENTEVDYILQGEGEYSFYRICKSIIEEKGANLEKVPGLYYREDEKIRNTPVKPLPLPPPSPYTKECLEQVKARIVYVETSRGCPFSCAFCLSGRDDSLVFFNLDQAKKDLLLAANSGTSTVKLVDRTFNCNAKRAKALFSFLMEEQQKGSFPEDICFHFEIGADLFDEETLLLLQKAPAGLFQVEAGIQSFQEETLLACRRKTNMEKLTHNLMALLAKQNIHVHIDLIAGLPLESFELFEQSFKQALSLQPHMLQLGFLKLIYGSALREEQEKHAYIAQPYPPYEVLQSRWLSFEEMARLKTVEKGLDYFYNKGRFPQTIQKLLTLIQKSALLFFEDLGKAIEQRGGKVSFENSCLILWEAFSENLALNPNDLRNLLINDLLTYQNTGYLPAFLRKEEEQVKQVNIEIRKKYPKGSKLGIGFLYGGAPRVLVADYGQKAHPVTGEYPTATYLIDQLGAQ